MVGRKPEKLVCEKEAAMTLELSRKHCVPCEGGVPALAPWLTKQFSVEAFSARHLNLVGKRRDDLSRSPGGECNCTNEGF